MRVVVLRPPASTAAGPIALLDLPPVPRDDAAWRDEAEALRLDGPAHGGGSGLRGAISQALVDEQRRLRAGPAAEANARALGDGAVAVVAGQQPGLFGGPLFALHKAAAAIALARRLSDAGVRAVPVFWVASEDHDLAECDRATVLDVNGQERDLSLGLVADGRSVHDVPVPAEAASALRGALEDALPKTERAKAAVDAAWPDLPSGADLGARSCAAIRAWLGDSGLVLVEPHAIAPWAGPALETLVARADEIQDAVRAAGADLRRLGRTAVLSPAPGHAPLFLRETWGGPRRRVEIAPDGRVRIGDRPTVDGDDALDRERLQGLVRSEPRLASADVVGRVFVQDALLPVVAQIAGPTERAYLAQVARAMKAVGRRVPVVVPRPEATWVDAKSARVIEAFGVGLEEFLADAPRPEALAADDPTITDLRARVEAAAAAASGAEAKPLREAAEALGRAAQAAADRCDEECGRGRARWARARSALRPKGRPQERVLSPASIAARHGIDALRSGLAALDPLAPGHQAVFLDAEDRAAGIFATR